MRAIDSAMSATTGHDVLSDAEVESLLAGLVSRPPQQGATASPAPTAESAGETALQAFAAALQAQFDYASIPLIVESGRPLCNEPLALGGTPLRRPIESAPPVELLCARELIVGMVDYRFGGPGIAAACNPLQPLGVTERRALESLLDSIGQVWQSSGAMLETAARAWFAQQSSAPGQRLTFAFSVRAGASAGMLALNLNGSEREGQLNATAEAESLTLIAALGRIRLSSEAAQSLSVGDFVAFDFVRPIEVICAGLKLSCAHGSSAGRHALRVLAVSPAAAATEPGSTDEIEYTLELGRRQFSRQALEAIEVGDVIFFDQAVDAPLQLSCQERCCGYAEIVVLPDGHAIRIVAWQT